MTAPDRPGGRDQFASYLDDHDRGCLMRRGEAQCTCDDATGRPGDQSQELDRCSYCGTRVGNDPFTYRDRGYCCNCMSALCSWLLDGGTITDPDMFDVAVES